VTGRFMPAARADNLPESRQAALVQPRLDVAIAHAFQINHGRGDIAVTHPLLQGADIDAVLQMACGDGLSWME
jgi:hypothetical protein